MAIDTLSTMEVNVKRLRELRQLRALTLRELGELARVSYATIWRIENGHKDARPSTIRKLACALGVEPEELIVVRSGDA
jgi:transcriptional regulator with XRE-family HTH domain